MEITNISRSIDLKEILKRKSCFLLGPRQTGKSWLVRNQLQDAKVYNLLEVDTYRALNRRPNLMREELREADKIVVIDEIQLIPELLNEVQLLIEEHGVRFLLTGSSARKLRRNGVNLLGGRAQWKNLHPFVRSELGDKFDLNRTLMSGLLPSMYFSEDYLSDFADYTELYLREEIANETAIRQLPAYSRFLDVAALCNSQIINYTNIANDAQLPPTTVREYFEVLKDTLLIHRLPAWRESKKRKATARDKYYFFDIGLARYLQGRRELVEGSEEFGAALESYVFHELNTHSSYSPGSSGEALAYWRTTSGLEVDFIIGNHTAVEVKANRHVSDRHAKGLRALKEEAVFKNLLLVSLDNRERISGGIRYLHLTTFLDELWGELFTP